MSNRCTYAELSEMYRSQAAKSEAMLDLALALLREYRGEARFEIEGGQMVCSICLGRQDRQCVCRDADDLLAEIDGEMDRQQGAPP